MQIQQRAPTSHLTASITECRKTESTLVTSRTRRSQLGQRSQNSVTKLQNKPRDHLWRHIKLCLVISNYFWSRSESPAPGGLGTYYSNLTHESFTRTVHRALAEHGATWWRSKSDGRKGRNKASACRPKCSETGGCCSCLRQHNHREKRPCTYPSCK